MVGLFDTKGEEATIFCNISRYTTSHSVTSCKAQVFSYTVNPIYECYITNANNVTQESMGSYSNVSVELYVMLQVMNQTVYTTT